MRSSTTFLLALRALLPRGAIGLLLRLLVAGLPRLLWLRTWLPLTLRRLLATGLPSLLSRIAGRLLLARGFVLLRVVWGALILLL